MSVPRKQDSGAIRDFMRALPAALKLGPRRWVWPRYAYRFDDVVTIAEILRNGSLLSRSECKRRGIQHRDQANSQIIENTPHLHTFARLFFRPRTPTQYRMEGIHPRDEVARHNGAHCPVPVFLLFSSVDVLTRAGVLFTNGSPTRRGQYLAGEDVDFLRQIPFATVYHEGGMGSDPARKSEIMLRRHAEILVPDELDLDGLQHVVCRTEPERQTLIHLLGEDAPPWIDKIRNELPGEDLFDRRGFFIRQLTLIDDTVHIGHSRHRGVFRLFFRAADAETGQLLCVHNTPAHQFGDQATIKLPTRVPSVELTIMVDDATAFSGVLVQRPDNGIVR